MRIPSGTTGFESAYARRGPDFTPARDARAIDDAQFEELPRRAASLARPERIERTAPVETAVAAANPAVGTYLDVLRNSVADVSDAEIAGIDVYV